MYLNINSLLPKIDEHRNIAKLSNAAVIGIDKSRLDDSVLSSEIQIDNYNTFRYDRNRHGGGVVCYIRNNLNYDVKSFFRLKLKVFSLKHFYQIRIHPVVVQIIYWPPSQSKFLEIIITHFSKLDTNNDEIYLLGEF